MWPTIAYPMYTNMNRMQKWNRSTCFGVLGSGFRVQDFGFRIPGSGFRVQDFGFRISGSGFRVYKHGENREVEEVDLYHRVWSSGSGVQGFGFWV
jgi:hypothetical protein